MQHFTGKEYLKIDIANSFGLDKMEWHDRIGWFDSNENQLNKIMTKAEEPAMFYSGMQAWQRAKEGKPSGYPISLDATSSGIQLLACLTGDRQSAELCNVVDTGKRGNAYNTLYKHMVNEIGDSAKIDAKDVKKAIMTSFYGSEAQPKSVFGEGLLLEVFYKTMEERCPGAWELNKAMLSFWDPTASEYNWVLPDNFHVHVKVMQTVTETVHFLNKNYEVNYTINAPMEQGRSLGANSTHSCDGMVVREMTRRCSYDPSNIKYVLDVIEQKTTLYNVQSQKKNIEMVDKLWNLRQQSGFLSARILDYIDSTNFHIVDRVEIFDLIASLPKRPFNLLAVHDCFRCLPNYGNDMRQQYNNILSDIAKSEMLSFMLTQITGRKMNVGKLDYHLWKDVKNADYALS